MSNRHTILFAHSAGAQSKSGEGSYDLVAYLRKELPDDYTLRFPLIEEPEAPTYAMWKKLFDSELKNTDKPMLLIGHSLGGSMLLKYLSLEKPEVRIEALFLVSTPYWGNQSWDASDFMLPENFASRLKPIGQVFLYHSKEDDIVPFEHLNFYRKAFPDATVRILNDSDHVFADGLPQLLYDIQNINHQY